MESISTQSPDLFSQYAQDPLLGFDEQYPEIANSHRERQSKKKRELVNKKNKSRSYISSKQSNKTGMKLIQIKIIDLTKQIENDDNIILNTQYVVTDVMDDILDHTESVVRKISKKICDQACND